MKLELLQPAQDELDQAVAYYNQQLEDLGLSFAQEVKDAFARIKAQPASYIKTSQNVRKSPLHRFPYHVFYSYDDSEILVLAIGHNRRKPMYWSKRLRVHP